ncbi:MAG: bifunctional riboflavin kinase/FAD synthetase [Tissierellia bacterium]|nr:bifunctional riboflavin kinase/FAD synthetase [Tissierellia bacterium]
MRIIDLDNKHEIIPKNNFIALGNFDGIHVAHASILESLVRKSKECGCNSSILIFKEHTLNSFSVPKPKLLTNLEEKLNIIEKFNIDQVFLVSFESIKDLEFNEFVEKFLMDFLYVKGIFVGFDYKFGRLAKGSVDDLKIYREKGLLKLWIEDSIEFNKQIISSTLIKELIEANQLDLAEELLGRPYFLNGIVVKGKKLGSKLGFPTANLQLVTNYVLPSEGVYYTELIVDDKSYKAATSLGINATLNEKTPKLEAHIINFDKQIYGKLVKIRFIHKLRDMIKFNNLSELTSQVKEDIDNVKKLDSAHY